MASNKEIEMFLSKFVRDYIFHFNMLERNIAYSLRHIRKQDHSFVCFRQACVAQKKI
jgi:hypothetical protein